jgi:TRAP-type C4-dicarboxylate transport system permease small subunit
MNRLLDITEKITRVGGLLSAACIVLMVLLILAETSLRLLLERSLFIAEEFSAYLMANFVMLGLAHTLREGGHIRVNILLSRLGGKGRVAIELIGCLVGFGVFLFMTRELWAVMFDNYATNQRSMNVTNVPIFLPQIGLVAGSALMTLQMAAEALRHIVGITDKKEH